MNNKNVASVNFLNLQSFPHRLQMCPQFIEIRSFHWIFVPTFYDFIQNEFGLIVNHGYVGSEYIVFTFGKFQFVYRILNIFEPFQFVSWE